MRRHQIAIAIAAAAVLVACATVFAPSTHAATPPGMPPTGKVMLGLGGTFIGPTEFDGVTRLPGRHKIHLVTIPWDERRYGGWEYATMRRFEDAKDDGYRLMLHVGASTTSGAEGRSPGAVARGDADDYLLDMSRVINGHDQYVYLRPPAEMNGHWSRWSAFGRSGKPRNADHRTIMYRQAFRRMALIARGGDVGGINARLRRFGMPPLRTGETTLPRSGKVAMVWNPQAEGSPNVRGNMPKDYYPGAGFVDYVANDLYIQRGRAAWTQHEALYNRYKAAHPFMVAEYAPWGYDDPAFIKRMFAWARTHPRTVALLYFNGTSGELFRLHTKPRSRAAYTSLGSAGRYFCPGLSSTSTTC